MTTHHRDDLFTHIHKGLRLELFETAVQAGRTDWEDADEVAAFAERWRSLHRLLAAHTAHEDDHILRLLDSVDAVAVQPVEEQHRDLDDLLEELDGRVAALAAAPGHAVGLGLYRDLNRYIAAVLPHLHDEETRIMACIWATCTDEQIAACRAAFMADTSPEVMASSLRAMLPALDGATRRGMLAGLAATAPPPVVDGVLAIAASVLPAAAVDELRALRPAPVG